MVRAHFYCVQASYHDFMLACCLPITERTPGGNTGHTNVESKELVTLSSMLVFQKKCPISYDHIRNCFLSMSFFKKSTENLYAI